MENILSFVSFVFLGITWLSALITLKSMPHMYVGLLRFTGATVPMDDFEEKFYGFFDVYTAMENGTIKPWQYLLFWPNVLLVYASRHGMGTIVFAIVHVFGTCLQMYFCGPGFIRTTIDALVLMPKMSRLI